ncbi:SNAPC1 family protein [Megaselia abdita]
MYIAKYILWKDKSELQRIGALYLLYSIYYKHECYLKIEVTLAQWKAFKSFISSLPTHKDYDQPKAIFSKLIRENAFRFVFSDVVWGLEEFFNPYVLQNNKSTVEFQSTRSVFSKELSSLTEEHNGFIAAFSSLEEGYNEMKESLNIPYSSNRTCTDLLDRFKQLQRIIVGAEISTENAAPTISTRRAIKQKAFSLK